MKLSTTKNEIVRGGVSASGEFKIKATAKAFNILSSGLYSDKIKAVIRELSCNAYDAHVAAGKADVPFEIKLPTTLEPTFYVKDFGTGLSEEDVFNLYTTYFDSTKSDSNDYVGALGLGSKSPFSYTNSFTVESRYRGRKYVFNAFLNETGLPEIAKLADEATDEPNGLTVMFSAHANDIPTFRERARVALMYFNPQPTVLGWKEYQQLNVHVLFEGANWRLVKRDSVSYYVSNDGPAIKQGPVIYPINIDILRREKVPAKVNVMFDLSLDVEVPMGTVDIAASREALSYDKRTVANLIAVFEKIANEFETSISTQIAAAPTLWDARIRLAALMSSSNPASHTIRKMIESGSISAMWKGQKVETRFVMDLSSLKHSTVNTITRRSWKKRNYLNHTSTTNGGKGYPVEDLDETTVFLADLSRTASNDIIGQFLVDPVNTKQGKRSVQAIVLYPNSKSDEKGAAKEVVELCKLLGGATYKLVSKLPYTPSKKIYTYKARKKSQVWTWDGFKLGGYNKRSLNTTYSKLTWNTVDVDFADGGLYLEVDRFTPVYDKREIVRLDMIVQMMNTLGIKLDFFAMNEKQVAAAKKEGDWKPFIPAVIAAVNKMNANSEIDNALSANRIRNNLNDLVYGLKGWKAHVKDYSSSDFVDFINDIVSVLDSPLIEKADEIAYGLRQLGIHDEAVVEKRTKSFLTRWTNLQQAHPMLQLVNMRHLDKPSHFTMILDYVSRK